MKVPPSNPPPEKGVTYDKDRTWTRRNVAGAAGGMKGVDYEDDRRPDPTQSAPGSSGPKAGATAADRATNTSIGGQPDGPTDSREPTADPAKILREEDGPAPLHTRRRRRFVARDRLTIDKDAPEKRKKPTISMEDDADETAHEDSVEIFSEWLGNPEPNAGSAAPSVPRAHLFSDAPREPGDLSLTDPDAIQRALETPLAYAKQAMILAEAFRRATGATRDEAIDYLGRMFVAPRDRVFGRSALKEFGPSSGILDIYPLEVVEHMLDRFPGFLPKVSLGAIFSREGARAEVLSADTATPIELEYPEDLKIRGFALKGGGRPGYTFEPGDRAGLYRLHIKAPGRWTCLVSGVSRTGQTTVDAVIIEVKLAAGARPEAASAEVTYREREPARVSAWPVPPEPSWPPDDSLDPDPPAPVDEGRLSTSELLHQRSLDDERRLKDIDFQVVESDAPISRRNEAPELTTDDIPTRPTRAEDPRRAKQRAGTPRIPPPAAITEPSVLSAAIAQSAAAGAGGAQPGARSIAQAAQPSAASIAQPAQSIAQAAQAAQPAAPQAPTTQATPQAATQATAAAASPAPAPVAASRAQGAASSSARAPIGARIPPAQTRPDRPSARTSEPPPPPTVVAAQAAKTPEKPAPKAPSLSSHEPQQAPKRSPTPSPVPAPSAVPARAAPARPAPRGRPAPRSQTPAPPRPAVDRAEINGAIADAFARLAQTPVAPTGKISPEPLTPPPFKLAPDPVAPPPQIKPEPPRFVLEVRPSAPLVDDVMDDDVAPSTTDDVAPPPPKTLPARAQRISQEDAVVEETEPTMALEREAPTARISLAGIADDLELPPRPARKAAPRTLLRTESEIDREDK